MKKNYINLNGIRIKLTQEQVMEMQKSFGIGQTKLSDIPAGEPFKVGEYEFIVLEHFGDNTVVILKNLLHNNVAFGDNNNYDGSNADKLCNEFAKAMAELVGGDNIVEHTVDLTSDDGLKDYGTIKRKASLLTCEQYRKYVYTFDKHKLEKYWWLATPHSTEAHGGTSWVKCVSPGGSICNVHYDNCFGVRPFCILKSRIFVSE